MNQTLMFHGVKSASLERRPEAEGWLQLSIDAGDVQYTVDIFAHSQGLSEVVCGSLTLIDESDATA